MTPYRKPRDQRTDAENNALEAVENTFDTALDGVFNRIDGFGIDVGLVEEAIKHLYGWEMADAWTEWVAG